MELEGYHQETSYTCALQKFWLEHTFNIVAVLAKYDWGLKINDKETKSWLKINRNISKVK